MNTTKASPSVIVADNNEFYRQVLGDFYREIGFEVRVASDGIETLAMVKERRPSLLVLDLIMPRFDGARLSSFLKSQERYRDIPIIILSGILADEIEGVEEIRADAYIAKMPIEQIRQTLQEISSRLVAGPAEARPILSGFEKMYRREVVLELLQERKTSQITLDSLSEGIVELTQDRCVLICNRAFQQLTGQPFGAMLARPLETIFPESREALGSLFDEISRGATVAATVIHQGDRHFQIKLHRIDLDHEEAERARADRAPEPGGVRTAVKRAARTTSKVRLETMINLVGYTVLFEDITGRVKAERERELLRTRLAQSEKMSAIGLFVAGAAHELNNPLTSVLGYSQLLAQKHRGSGLEKELDKIAAGASRCKSILENLMAFARSNRPAKVAMDFNALLMESLLPYRDRLRREGIDVTYDLQPDLPETLADPGQIVQAFKSILDNAMKALAGFPGTRALSISSKASMGRIIVQIDDTGPGIPEEVLGKVFEPFFTTRQVGQGAGLGLSVAYGVATAHGGRINARNRPSGGATVTLEFPVTTAEEGEVAERRTTEPPAAMRQGRRILIVDDEAVVQELLVDILETNQCQIDTASNGVDGLRRIDEREYDLIILDLRMPDMTGQEVYEHLARQRPDLLGRLVFITADTVTPDVARFLKSVGSPCLMKPFAIDAVKERVQTILGTSER